MVVAVDFIGADVWGASEQVNHGARGPNQREGRSEPVLAYRLVGLNEPGAKLATSQVSQEPEEDGFPTVGCVEMRPMAGALENLDPGRATVGCIACEHVPGL